MAYDFISKILCVLFMKSQTVIFFISVPLFQFNNKVYRLGIFNTLNTKQSLNINNTYTTQFNEMSCNVRRRTYQGYITDFTKFNNIITYKTMTTFDQFQSSFTLTNSTFASDQDAFTIYIHKYTVNRDTWCKLYA